MSAASSATRATTPINQPIVARECPGAPARPERPEGLRVNTAPHTAQVLVFEDPQEACPGAPIKKPRISAELDMSAKKALGF
jgi:hypothetical protein